MKNLTIPENESIEKAFYALSVSGRYKAKLRLTFVNGMDVVDQSPISFLYMAVTEHVLG